MRLNHLAHVMPVDLAAGDSNALRQMLWGKAVELLQPQLGKWYSRFEPAATAWGQSINRPYGIILGKNDPALFLFSFVAAKAQQESVIQLHLNSLPGGAYPISRKEAAAHILWPLKMLDGELLPDCGIYFVEEQDSLVSKETDQRVLSQMNRYAICVVTLVAPEGGVRGE